MILPWRSFAKKLEHSRNEAQNNNFESQPYNLLRSNRSDMTKFLLPADCLTKFICIWLFDFLNTASSANMMYYSISFMHQEKQNKTNSSNLTNGGAIITCTMQI